MKETEKKSEVDDEMRPEYDFSKLKFVGRGIYAEAYRKGVEFYVVPDDEIEQEQLDEQSRNIPHPT